MNASNNVEELLTHPKCTIFRKKANENLIFSAENIMLLESFFNQIVHWSFVGMRLKYSIG